MNEPETKFVPYASTTEVGSTTAVNTEETYDVSAIVPENAVAVVILGRYNFAGASMTLDVYGKSGVVVALEVQRITAHANAVVEPDLQHVMHIIPLDAAKKFYSLKSAAGAIDDGLWSWLGWIEAIQPKVI